jgi:hypothetical protein
MMLNLLLVSYVGLSSVHPMSTEIPNCVVNYKRHEPRLESLVPPPQVQKALIPAFMVRYVQLRFSRWIETQLNSSTPVAPPQLTTLFDKIFVGEQWTPPFPAAYLEPAYPQQALSRQLQQQQQQQPPQQQQQQQQQQPPPTNDNRVTNERFNPALAQYRDWKSLLPTASSPYPSL